MRVVEPHQFKRKHGKAEKTVKPALLVVVVTGIIIVGAFLVYKYVLDASVTTKTNTDSSSSLDYDVPEANAIPQPKTGPFKQFTGEEFKALYKSVALPNIEQIDSNLVITGNEVADIRIKKLAEERGYQLSGIPQGAIIKLNESRLSNDDLLQPLAAVGWQTIKEAARKDGYPLSIVSAYRSPEYQRDLFTERLYVNGTSAKLIADGVGDMAIKRTLEMTAVPGYSRHHTGYTIDLWCEDGSGSFRSSSCYQWISENNYLHAKEHGWIPSYPEGTDLQGPEPEPWEYVWVGTDVLRN